MNIKSDKKMASCYNKKDSTKVDVEYWDVGQTVYRAVIKMAFPNNANKGRSTSSKSFRQMYLITMNNNGKLPPRVKDKIQSSNCYLMYSYKGFYTSSSF